MLLLQRAVVEGSLALILHCGMYKDIHTQNSEMTDCHLLLELLTPVAKTFPSEMGILSTSAAIQCLGGYGYCDDFPVEQHFRDMRIHPIHEGTTGIQAMDLLGRKLVMENGRALQLLKQEITDALDRATTAADSHDAIGPMAHDLEDALVRVEQTAMTLGGVATEKGPEAFLADATLFLEMFGITVIAWQWLTMATAAATALAETKPKRTKKRFLEGKLATAQYFFTYELPKTRSLAVTLETSTQMTCTLADDWFTD
jgi:butyryl-CoA dehydrogenase